MKLAKDFPIGSSVLVGKRYDGGGRFVSDNGAGNTYFVIRHCGQSDLVLGTDPDDDHWDYIMHVSRLVENGAPIA